MLFFRMRIAHITNWARKLPRKSMKWGTKIEFIHRRARSSLLDFIEKLIYLLSLEKTDGLFERTINLSSLILSLLNYYRQLNGEELQGLGIEELDKLEKTVQTGLNRVQNTKVNLNCIYVYIYYHAWIYLCSLSLMFNQTSHLMISGWKISNRDECS